MERLSKFISRCGIASRRKSDEIIKSGRVKVNNDVILEPYFNVDCYNDYVTVDNVKINELSSKIYIVLNKPVGYISDLKDTKGRKVARGLIDIDAMIFPVGRLDYNSEGLMLFTNDGDLANRIMHPRYGIEKEYLVKFKGKLSEDDLASLTRGIMIDGVISIIKSINHISSSFKNNWYRIVINEGRNRIIRKFGDSIDHQVLKLKRTRIGHIKLGKLNPGEYIFIDEKNFLPFKMPLK